MQVKLNYFGIVQEIAGKAQELMEVAGALDTEILSQLLNKKYKGLEEINYRIAINQRFSNESLQINEADEIALLPAFSGG